MTTKPLTGICTRMEQGGVMRNHLIHDDVLLNETDLSCVHRALLPDLPQPENMKTYSFNYSGQLLFFLIDFCSLFTFSNIAARFIWVNNRGTNTTVQINTQLLLRYKLSIIPHLVFPVRVTVLALDSCSYWL